MGNKKTEERRERRAAARRNQILDAAAEVFAEKGFARATTKEIADRADVSEGTIYNYFDSKEDLLIGMMARMAEMQVVSTGLEFTDEQRGQLEALGDSIVLSEALTHSTREFWINMLRWRHSFVTQNQTMLQALLAEILVNSELRANYNRQLVVPFMSVFERQVEERVARGEIHSVDVQLVVRFLLAMNLGMFGLLILGDPVLEEKWESEELIQALADFVLAGIGIQAKQ